MLRAPHQRRRRTPFDVIRRTAATAAAVVLAISASSCSGGGDDDRVPRGLVDSTSPKAVPSDTTAAADPPITFASPSGTSGLLNYPHLFAAMAVVPQQAAVVTFTDLDRVKKRLGYAEVTSKSPTSERFAFWERARADGAMFTGTRLYDASSVMSLDYGWTGEDVAWEVDFVLTEDGCGRSMLCDTSHGYVLGLRRDLDWSVVTKSLQDNGFEADPTDDETYRTDDPKAPFALVHLIPELHAVAGGNALGLQRISDVVDGAPPYAPLLGPIYDRLGTVESMHAATGCVELPNALGPDATTDDLSAFLKKNAINDLAAPVSTTVVVSDPKGADIEVQVGADAPADDLGIRQAAIESWPGLQTGIPFADVATVAGERAGDYESFDAEVSDLPTLRSMVLTDDAPWALCPYAEAG
jgi:hypothetical protein